MFLQTF